MGLTRNHCLGQITPTIVWMKPLPLCIVEVLRFYRNTRRDAMRCDAIIVDDRWCCHCWLCMEKATRMQRSNTCPAVGRYTKRQVGTGYDTMRWRCQIIWYLEKDTPRRAGKPLRWSKMILSTQKGHLMYSTNDVLLVICWYNRDVYAIDFEVCGTIWWNEYTRFSAP